MTVTLASRARACDARRDPMGLSCCSTDRPHRHGRVVSWYRGDPALGAWILWEGDELHRPRWEPKGYVVIGGCGR